MARYNTTDRNKAAKKREEEDRLLLGQPANAVPDGGNGYTVSYDAVTGAPVPPSDRLQAAITAASADRDSMTTKLSRQTTFNNGTPENSGPRVNTQIQDLATAALARQQEVADTPESAGTPEGADTPEGPKWWSSFMDETIEKGKDMKVLQDASDRLLQADYKGSLLAQSEAGSSTSQGGNWKEDSRDLYDLAMGGGVADWQAENEEVSRLVESITALREGQANFADDYADAVKYGDAESFLIGTANRDERLKKQVARYNEIQNDGLDPRAWVANILSKAGLDPRGMDEWTPEQVASQMQLAIGVMDGGIPNLDPNHASNTPPRDVNDGNNGLQVDRMRGLMAPKTFGAEPVVYFDESDILTVNFRDMGTADLLDFFSLDARWNPPVNSEGVSYTETLRERWSSHLESDDDLEDTAKDDWKRDQFAVVGESILTMMFGMHRADLDEASYVRDSEGGFVRDEDGNTVAKTWESERFKRKYGAGVFQALIESVIEEAIKPEGWKFGSDGGEHADDYVRTRSWFKGADYSFFQLATGGG